MNLRFPLVAGMVAVAGAAAGFRALHPAPPPPAVAAFESPGPAAPGSAAPHGRRLSGGPAVPGGRVVVYVTGEVRHSGVYALPASERAVDAVALAGGALDDADLVAVNLAAPLSDGEEIAVPAKGAAPAASGGRRHVTRVPHGRRTRRRGSKAHRGAGVASLRAEGSTSAGPFPDQGPDQGPDQVVDLNHADENELETLPGIGPALASRIVEFREANGPFSSLDDLLDVGGVTQRKLDDIAPYVATR